MTISGDYLFVGWVLMAVFFTWFSASRRNILLAFVGFILWFSLGFWLFFSTSAPIGLTEQWQRIFAWAFFVLSFLPFIFQMDIEVKNEMKGKSWKTFEPRTPEQKKLSGYEEYKEKLRKRTRGY